MDYGTLLSLTGLQFHWHDIYSIGVSPDEVTWSAVRIDAPTVVLTATSSMELKELIENDHAERKPPARRLPGESASL